MNEDNYWGCFYVYPDLYADIFSPVVKIRDIQDVPELVGGELTRDMVTACLTYLQRTPILGDLVFIKLDLSSKHLMKIDVLQHYKYLVYLNLSSNLLTELTVLSHLPYLQFLSVDFNRLSTVLDYKTPQWFLTEVHYKYNSVKRIRDLSAFWSITVLDLSHNNIKAITGLQNLVLRELHLRNNRFSILLELAVYMSQMRRLLILDLRANPICSIPGYKSVVINTFSMLLSLDAAELDPVEQRTLRMDVNPDVTMHATRKLLRLIYIQQLSKARISPYIPPADSVDVPLVILVGHEGVGKDYDNVSFG
ncbi:unnamed protein product [Spodoptera exigua]|nr:unnamed protein product [Spodoptera exigua]